MPKIPLDTSRSLGPFPTCHISPPHNTSPPVYSITTSCLPSRPCCNNKRHRTNASPANSRSRTLLQIVDENGIQIQIPLNQADDEDDREQDQEQSKERDDAAAPVQDQNRHQPSYTVQDLEHLVKQYPLTSRPYYEARRRRQIPKSAVSAMRVTSGILDDFYLNLLDWGRSGLIALATSAEIALLQFNHNSLSLTSSIRNSNANQSSASLVPLEGISAPPSPLNTSSPASDSVRTREAAGRSTATTASATELDYTGVRWSPEGSRLALGTRSGVVEVWDMESIQKIRDLNGHVHRVGALDWIPADTSDSSPGLSQMLTTGSRDKLVVHHDLRIPDSSVVSLDRHRQEVCGIRWRDRISRDRCGVLREQIAALEEHSSSKTQTEGESAQNTEDVFKQDELRACAARPFTTKDAHRDSYSAILGAIRDLGGSSDDNPLGQSRPKLATGGNDNKVYIWELGYNVPLLRLSVHTAAVKALAWAPMELPLLATGGGTNDRSIRLWDVGCKTELATFETESQVCNLHWSPRTLELVSSHGYTLNQVNMWDVRRASVQDDSEVGLGNVALGNQQRPLTLRKLVTLTGHTARVLYMGASEIGGRVCTAAGDGSIRVWDTFFEDENVVNNNVIS